jgi:hypothetical protein
MKKFVFFLGSFAVVALAGLGAASPGLYELSFDTTGPVPLTNNSLPVGQELVLKAHVENGAGQPALRGAVIFEDCEMKNHLAPSATCDSGPGVWSHIFQIAVDASGNAAVDYGFLSTPTTVGFRFRYIGQGSGIANGKSLSADVTWFQ